MKSFIRLLMVAMISVQVGILEAGDLSGLRSDLHSDGSSKSPSNPPKNKPSRNSSYDAPDFNDDGDSLSDEVGTLAFLGLAAGVTAPFWAPHMALDDSLDRDGWFPKHPYQHFDGALTHDHSIMGTHDTAIILQGVFGTDFDDMRLFNGRALIEHSSRFGIDSEFNYRRESLPLDEHDDLWNGDFNITYRFAQHEHWLIRAGLGMNWLDNRGKAELGFNFTYGVDWYPVDPVVVSGVIDWGRVSGASLFHGRTTLGVTHKGWGAFTGYDYFRISDSVQHSWINGIELRF